ncbi:MAG: iron-sulfur cluster-binding protein [Chloroflexi bacterium]|nr:iron-sulfur cluster-binding protein [Chloroflexota bacterium]
MHVKSNQFIKLSQIAVTDEQMKTAVSTGTQTAYNNRIAAMRETSAAHGEMMRQQAAAIKRSALNHLPELLEKTETNMQANGIHVLWAADAAEARQHVLAIAQQHNVKKVTKSKSMVTEEIALNDALEAAGIETIETDLGEYILQLNQEPPSHIVTPVIHKSKESIRDIFEAQLEMPPTNDAREMAHFARQKLREAFLSSDMGITGGNFLVAETGSLGLVTNEGNARMVTSLPPVHVAIVGIEKIVPTMADYATLTQMISRSATGQKLAVYTHLINGPRREHEPDGSEHVYVVLVDNGRSNIYLSDYTEALACIRCGACLNACPVYKVTGGHTYGWVYPGPIGAIVTPLLTGLENASPLPYASSLCGDCKQVCPVDIDIPRMLLDLRHDLVQSGQQPRMWQWGMKAWAFGNTSPGRFQLGGKVAAKVTNKLSLNHLPGPLSGWTNYRTTPSFAPKSFRELWQEREDNNES